MQEKISAQMLRIKKIDQQLKNWLIPYYNVKVDILLRQYMNKKQTAQHLGLSR